jgi:aldose 1-epimerase
VVWSMNIETTGVLGKWKEFTLTNEKQMSVSVLNYGGIITKIIVPDRNGVFENVALGFKDYRDYEANPPFLGALIGRVAGRIQGSSFELNGESYPLEANDGENHLHGGSEGFHQIIWDVTPFKTEGTVGLTLTHKSAAGEGGYPGNVEVKVTYTLNNENQLSLFYEATSDQTTPLTLTNHCYFNLSGDLKSTVQDHHVTIDSHQFVELDEELIPTGAKPQVVGTTFDFRQGRRLGDGFNDKFQQNQIAGNGYDHYFIFDDKMEQQAVVREPNSGRVMSVKTNQPGMVMYTGNSLDDQMQLAEATSQKYLGVCFETQASPASLHHEGFPEVRLNAGEKYEKETVFTFGIK